MIHFSLTPEDADFVMRALIMRARLEKSFGPGKRTTASLRRTRGVVSAALKAATHEQTQPYTPKKESSYVQ